jgi:predicted nucleic acid-binding Zn ribbon protein
MSAYQKGPENKCECGNNDYERVIGGTSFILKGTGWYRDQYTSTGKPVK